MTDSSDDDSSDGLVLDRVSRRFGEVQALRDMAFAVRPGRLTGFVGANGAGKTTTMRIILGTTRADAGTVTWQGRQVDAGLRRQVGYMPEERGLYPKMRVAEQLVFFARLHGVERGAAGRAVDALLGRLGLTGRAGDQLETLSLGNQQRVQMAAALVHDPVLLVLDEPFSGLDPLAVDALASLLRERAALGVPVLFSSHQLELVERLCDEVVIIAAGQVQAAGTVEQLRSGRAPSRYRLHVEPDAGWLRGVPGLTVIDVEGPRAVVDLDGADLGEEARVRGEQCLLDRARERGQVREFSRVIPRLADLFAEVTR